MAEVLSSTSKSDEDFPLVAGRSFPPPPNERLPSPPTSTSKSDEDSHPLVWPRSFPPPPNERLPSPPAITVSDTDGSGSGWEGSRRNKTISGVTYEARRVLDMFLRRTLLESGQTLFHDVHGGPRRPRTSRQDEMLIQKLERKLQQLQNLSQAEEEDQDSEDLYVPLYPHASGPGPGLQNIPGLKEIQSQSTFEDQETDAAAGASFLPKATIGGLQSPPPKTENQGEEDEVDVDRTEVVRECVGPIWEGAEGEDVLDSCLPTPRERRRTINIPGDESISSSSTEDYELVDPNELLNRKKKSFFRRATERLMQSFRRRKELHGMEGELESPKEESVPGEHLPGTPILKPPKKKGFSKKGSGALFAGFEEQHFSDTALRGKAHGFLHTPKKKQGHAHLTKTGSSSGDNAGGVGVIQSEGEDTRSKIKKSPLPWKHKVRVKEEGVDRQSLFDNFIRGIRKSSFKLKRKGSKDHQRSRSADNLTVRPLSKEHQAVLRRYMRHSPDARPSAGTADASDGTESDNATVRSIHEVAAHRISKTNLRLPGLVPTSAAGGSTSISIATSRVPAPDGSGQRCDSDDNSYDEICDMPPGQGHEISHSETGEDELDGMLQQIFQRQASKPFHERTEAEKEQLYEKIAEQLAAIADFYNANLGSPLAPPDESSAPAVTEEGKESSNSDKEGTAAARALHRKRRRWKKQLAKLGISDMDEVKENLAGQEPSNVSDPVSDPAPIVEELVRNASYSKFQQIVSQNIGDEPGWDQIAMMFKLTQTAVGLAGMGTAAALQIKEITLKYFEDKFAGWIVHQGGWESVVEDTNTENDSELD